MEPTTPDVISARQVAWNARGNEENIDPVPVRVICRLRLIESPDKAYRRYQETGIASDDEVRNEAGEQLFSNEDGTSWLARVV